VQAIGQLAGGVAHDFNNLLCVSMANAAVLRHTLEEGAAAESPLDHIEQASERAAILVTDVVMPVISGRAALTPLPVKQGRQLVRV